MHNACLLVISAAIGAFDFWRFCNDYGNAAGVIGLLVSAVGLLVSVIAFPLTWRLQRRIRREVQQTTRRLALAALAGQLTDLDRLLTALKEACRLCQWPRAYDRAHDARALAIRTAGNPYLSAEDQDSLGISADELQLIAAYIDKKFLNAASPPASFHPSKHKALDDLIGKLGRIRSRLESQTWEV